MSDDDFERGLLRQRLDPAALQARLGDPWRIEIVSETASTNADLKLAASAGAAQGLVRIAEYQYGGRGRLDRTWTSPPGAGLTLSLLLRPSAPLARWGWIPLLAGLALRDTIGRAATLKWPNDLLLGPNQLKAAGILVEAERGAAVVGIGLNVSTKKDELPVPTATSLAIEGQRAERTALVVDLLTNFWSAYERWEGHGGRAGESGIAARYRAACSTIGTDVTIQQDGGTYQAHGLSVDDEGRLVVRRVGATGVDAISAADITHLRPASG